MALIKNEKIEIGKDNRGFSAKPVDENALKKGEALNLHVVSMNPGAVRGNHYHKKQSEIIWVIGGPCIVTAKNRDSGEVEKIEISPENNTLLTISPEITHAIKNISDEIAYLLCYSDYSVSEDDKDVFRDKLVE